NRTIGSSAMGGMFIGTIFGVLVIPGLYYFFANLIKGRTLIKGENTEPVFEEMVRESLEEQKSQKTIQKLNERIRQLLGRKNNRK
ncbi:MAG: hypothetical protein KDB98_07395, partial [Flavobacteriales bacterium]|nr:hypothetical protein [Flavobacteriales bacterium]